MQLIVFDCDGTLVDSRHMICAAMQHAYRAHGLAVPSKAQMLSIVGLSLQEAFQQLAGAEAHPVDGLVEQYKAAFGTLRQAGDYQEELFPGAREAIETLAARPDTVLGIASGKSQRGIRAALGRHGLYDRFQTIQTADDAPSKPHPGMVEQAMRAVGAAPAETVVVGDTVFDVEMARAAGVAAIGVGWGYHPASALRAAGAVEVIEAFDQLAPLLDAWPHFGAMAPR